MSEGAIILIVLAVLVVGGIILGGLGGLDR